MPKYKLNFKKQYQTLGIGVWEEVTDSSLMAVLLRLQEKYNFEILSINLKIVFILVILKSNVIKMTDVKYLVNSV